MEIKTREQAVAASITNLEEARWIIERYGPTGGGALYRAQAATALATLAQVLPPEGVEIADDELAVGRGLLESLVEGDSCEFDHHGGCQAHGYLSLDHDELCPQEELKRLLRG